MIQTETRKLTLKQRETWFQATAKKIIHKALAGLHTGRLTITESGDTVSYGEEGATVQQAEIIVFNPCFYTDILLGGSVGAGESYMEGHWGSPNLATVIRLMSRNMDVLDRMEGGLAVVGASFLKVLNWLRRNTKHGSKKNIAAHYDLGNEFFERFLDPTMMYSSAVFPNQNADLQEASLFKLDRICKKLDLKPEDHVIEIGTGWGGFAIYAALHYGCRVTTTTISREQYEFARERVAAAGVGGQVTLLFEDYRDLKGQYDKLVSIEMIEAVGDAYLNTYFEQCAKLLKPDGIMLIQAITMPDDRYESALRSVDFIKRYIFPGSFIPSVGAMHNAMARKTDLRLFHFEDQTNHYAHTLRHWHSNFLKNSDEIRAMGYPERFIRMWEFYLKYCEGGFDERVIGCAQLVFTKPLCRRTPILQDVPEGVVADPSKLLLAS